MVTQLNNTNRTVNFTLTALNSNARPFHWELEGTGVNASCFEGGVISGTGNITHQATITLTVNNDYSAVDLKSFKIIVKDGDASGAVVATSVLVYVNIVIKEPEIPVDPETNDIGIFWNEGPSRDITEFEPANWNNEYQDWYLFDYVERHPTYYNSDGTVNTNKPTADIEKGLPWKHNYISSQFKFTDNQNNLAGTYTEYTGDYWRHYGGEERYSHLLFFRVNRDGENTPVWFRVAFYILEETPDLPNLQTNSFRTFNCEDYTSFLPVDVNQTNPSFTDLTSPTFRLFAEQYVDSVNYENVPTDIGILRFTARNIIDVALQFSLNGEIIDYYDPNSIIHSLEVVDGISKAKKVRAKIIQTSKNPQEIEADDTSFDLGVLTSFDFIVSNRVIEYNSGYGVTYHQIDSLLNIVPSSFAKSVVHEACNPVNHV